MLSNPDVSSGRPATRRPLAHGRRIRDMSGDLDPAGFADYLAGRAKWIALAVFAVFIALAAIGFTPAHPSPPVTAAGVVVAVGAAALLVLSWQPQLLYAAVATAGIAILADGMSSNIGWIAVCLLAGWCALTGSRRDGLAFWAGTMILFAVEWLWVRPDPGWGAWLGGVTLTVAFGLLVRHERDLLTQLRAAQAGLAEQAKTQERNRIARELHDVIGHTLTVSLLHVQSARRAVEHDPSDASRALAEAERLGRECLAEVRMTMGMLRQDGGAGDKAPLPGVDGLPALVERFQSAGGEARPWCADRGPGGGRRRHGDADRGQPGRAGHRHWPGRGQHAGARRVAGRELRGRAGRPGLAGAGHVPPGRGPAGRSVIRVLLVDDQELIRAGLRGILRAPFGFDVVGECAGGREAAWGVPPLAPDVVVMDVRMPAVDGVQATVELRRRDGSPPVLALTTFDDEEGLAGLRRR